MGPLAQGPFEIYSGRAHLWDSCWPLPKNPFSATLGRTTAAWPIRQDFSCATWRCLISKAKLLKIKN